MQGDIEGSPPLSQDMMVDQSKILGLCIINTNYIQQLVRKGGAKFALNQSQCTCLAQMLEQIIKNITSILSHVNELLGNFDLLLRELFRVVERAKLLIQQCYDGKWWHATLLQIHNEEAFQDLFMDLKSCYDDIFQHLKGQCVGQLDQYRNDMRFPSVPTMRKLVDDDHHALIKRLQATVESTHSSFNIEGLNEELAIATYLLNRYDNQRKHENGGHHVEVDAHMGWGGSIPLGGGAYGHVEKTTWFGLPCAKKVQGLGEMGDGEKTFKKEVAILAIVNHPNVVKFICCGRKPKKFKCFIAMELLDTSLEKLIKELSNDGTRTPFTIQVAVDIILQIAKGMSYLHEKNVVHRDLKPDNVLVQKIAVEELCKDNYVNVKLADFGLSKMDMNSNISEELTHGFGTRFYKAPETFKKTHTKNMMYPTIEKMNAHEADVYSFGVTCATILSGKQPFEGIDDNLLARLKSGERPWVPDDCPEPLVSLINECWSLDRTKRPKFKEICTTLKELRSSISKGNVALTNQEVENETTMFQRILNLPQSVIYLYEHFWKKPNLEARKANEAQHTTQIHAKNSQLLQPFSWANRILPSQVRSTHSLPPLPIHFVDIEEKVSKALSQLESSQILGIIGMGGSGKTTLTKAIMHRVHQGFEATSFVANMKDSKNGLDIQRQLLRDLKYERSISTVEEGLKHLQNIFEKMKVFVVLDDVASQEQLHGLVSSTWVFANGSKIIATSRNWQDLKTICVSHTGKMDMELLDKFQAKELFYKHAFSQQRPQEPQFEEVVIKVIEACGGLPLSLEVLGSYLCGVQRPRIWQQALQRLQKGQCLTGSWDNEKIWRTLRISYDNLNGEEKNMFLDIACFFCRDVLKEGMQEEKALRIWKCDGGNADLALLNLMDRSLVRIDSDGILTMHDHLRDMGRMIACKEHIGGQRIWNVHQFELDVHNACMMIQNVEGLHMDGSHCNYDINTTMDLVHMRLLHINNCEDIRSFYQILKNANKLRWMRISMVKDNNGRKILELQPSFFIPFKQLHVLEMEGFVHLKYLPPEIGALKMLEYLHLYMFPKLKELPETLGTLTSLVTLKLRGCKRIKELPGTLGNLTSLVALSLNACTSLKELPGTLGNLTSLDTLDLSGCASMKELPGTLGNLTSLVTLNLSWCARMKELPGTLGNLTSLVTLQLRGCKRLKELPGTLGNLTSLGKLDLIWCESLKELPGTLGDLTSLDTLDLSGCESLKELPGTLGNLTSLVTLDLSGCESLEELPGTLGNLTSLVTLNLRRCTSLKELPGTLGNLTSLGTLDLTWCESLKELPGTLGNLTSLVTLELYSCENLKELPGTLGNLTSLLILKLSQCTSLKELPGTLGNLTLLVALSLNACTSLKELPGTLGNLTSLVTLDLSWCESLKELPRTLGNLTSLVTLDLSWCESLKELPRTLGNLTSLVTLKLSACTSLKELPHTLGNLASLVTLDLSYCKNLKEIPEMVGNLSLLNTLNLQDCVRLRKLPKFLGNRRCLLESGFHRNLPNGFPSKINDATPLKCLNLEYHSELEEFPAGLVAYMSSLTTFRLYSCVSLNELQFSPCNLTSLTALCLGFCTKLKEIPEIVGQVRTLVTLDLSFCKQLKEIPHSLGNLALLKTLDLRCCENMVDLPWTLGNLTSLVTLSIHACTNLKKLPISLGKLASLVTFDLGSCVNLEEIPKTLNALSSLEFLVISGCWKLKKAPLRWLKLFHVETIPNDVLESSHDSMKRMQLQRHVRRTQISQPMSSKGKEIDWRLHI